MLRPSKVMLFFLSFSFLACNGLPDEFIQTTIPFTEELGGGTTTETKTKIEIESPTSVPPARLTQTASNLPPCEPIPYTTTPIDIGTHLPSGYEPSGTVWHPRLNQLFLVSDNGIVTKINRNGTNPVHWTIGGDLEGVTVANAQSNFIYIGVEHPDSIKEFNIQTGSVTRTFDLTPWMQGPNNAGLEALTFVPDVDHLEGGLFYAGHQGEGAVYVFSLPIKSSSTSTTVTPHPSFTPVSGRTDLSDMDYDPRKDKIYTIYDTANKIIRMNVDGTDIEDKNLPHDGQEGFAIGSQCEVFIAEDTGVSNVRQKVWYYPGQISGMPINDAALSRLANRLYAVQNDDGSFDWQQDADLALTPTQTGFQNVTGITALGLFDLMERLPDPQNFWKTTLDGVLSYLDGKLNAFILDPTNIQKNLSCPNWAFFSKYLGKYPNSSLQNKIVSAFTTLLQERDNVYGDNSVMRADGFMNRIIQARTSQNLPGIIPWDLSLCVEALDAMANLSSNFEGDVVDGLNVLRDHILENFLSIYDTNPTTDYSVFSLALPAFVLHQIGGAAYQSTGDLLIDRLLPLIQNDGSVSNVSEEESAQIAAYALLPLKVLWDEKVQTVQGYLENLIEGNGIIRDSNNIETYEVEGEVLRALVFLPEHP